MVAVSAWGESAHLVYAGEVRELCRLGRCPARAVGFIERGTSLSDVLAEMIEHVFGRTLPHDAARAMAPWPDLLAWPPMETECEG